MKKLFFFLVLVALTTQVLQANQQCMNECYRQGGNYNTCSGQCYGETWN